MNPAFRDLERAWRSVHWLVSRLEDDQAEVHLLDVSKAALGAHLTSFRERLETSPLHALISETDADAGWDLVVADYTFALAAQDLLLLATMGVLAARGSAPFIGHGNLSLAGCADEAAVDEPWNWAIPDDDLGNLWTEFRRHPAAGAVALAAPRFLLRYPYGQRADPVDAFAFEELPSRPERERFLWANPAFACALVMAQQDAPAGSEGADAGSSFVTDLPMPQYDDGRGQAIQPPVEFLLGERARAAAERAGLIVCAGGRNANRMSVGALRTLAAD